MTGEVDTLEYVACRRAFNEKMIEVREVSEAGSVNHLVVVNLSDHYVFLMDGDVLEGAKARIIKVLGRTQKEGATDPGVVQHAVREAVSQYIWERVRRRPMVIPIVMEV